MIRVIYHWRVHPDKAAVFIEAWAEVTRIISSSAAGARGSLLLRDREDPTHFTAVARWDSVEAWSEFRSLSRPKTELAVRMSSAGELLKTDLFDEIEDLTLTGHKPRPRGRNPGLL